MKPKFKVDAVILWVDGSDPVHKNKMIAYLDNPLKIQNKGMATRYRQVNEIQYTVKSILKFAPFIENIYIVTDNQTPNFLKENKDAALYNKVKIIDHTTIFRGIEEVLPLFNSNAIETMVHKIPDLAEHYMYFNDDMFLMNPTTVADFFNQEGLPIIRGKKMLFESNKLYKKIPLKLGLKKEKTKGYLGYKRKQDYFAKLMGETTKIAVDHTPFPMRKSIMESFFQSNEAIFQNNIQHKFRNEKNVLIQSISAYNELKYHPELLVEDYQLARFDSSNKPLFWMKLKLFLFKRNPKKIFLNIQSLDLYPKNKMKYILDWLDKLYIY